jgi:hypothetical protein
MTSGDPALRPRRPVTRTDALIRCFVAVTALGTAAPASAQGAAAAPAAAAFDGEYTGEATPRYSDSPDCDLSFTFIMTVAAPKVTIREFIEGHR